MPKLNHDKLAEKIAQQLNMSVEEIRESSKKVYTSNEIMLEGQAVLNYFTWRSERLQQAAKETVDQFIERERAWKYRLCKGCGGRFAYSYPYEGITCCSLDCLSVELQKVGLTVTYGRPLHLRWGYNYPAVVPAPALAIIETVLDS